MLSLYVGQDPRKDQWWDALDMDHVWRDAKPDFERKKAVPRPREYKGVVKPEWWYNPHFEGKPLK